MKDEVSALMDGELDDAAGAAAISRLGRDDGAREQWETYHLIGDTLRRQAAGSTSLQSRVFEALAAEPTVLAPQRRARTGLVRNVGLAAAASVATVSMVAWMAWQPGQKSDVAGRQPTAVEQGKTLVEALPPPGGDIATYLSAHYDFARPSIYRQPGDFVQTTTGTGR